MIGNDIIDLKVAAVNSRWKEQRFLDKIFSDEEQAVIMADAYHFQNIWRLWSMKESAYKLFAQTHNVSIFKPKHFKCDLISKTGGTVCYGTSNVHTITKTTSNVIYTIAQIKDAFLITNHFKLNKGSQLDKSKQLKTKAIQAFGQLRTISENNISIEKNHIGVPQFFINHRAQPHFLTLTHHGNYGGFAISY